MKYEEFRTKCEDLLKAAKNWEFQARHKNRYEVKTPDRLIASWETGGYSGGSCWGGTAEPYVSDEPEADLKSIDIILAEFRPNTTFLEYRALMNELEKTDTSSQSEYYGNSISYGHKIIELESLFGYFKDKEWVK